MQSDITSRLLLISGLVAAASAGPSSATRAAEAAATMEARDGSIMMLVPAGEFIMGSADGAAEETPIRRVTLPAFYIDKTEVTNAQYARYIAESGASPPIQWQGKTPPAGQEHLPITNITWFDAMRYAIWAGKRLPTEAEWEKAARGTDGRRYPWGQSDDPARRNRDDRELKPVDQYPEGASPYGCLNMSGNAWEWTADWFEAYPGSICHSAHFGKAYKVIRGGAAEYMYATDNRGDCTQRARLLPYGGHDFVGFRCVKDMDPATAPYNPAEALADAEKQLQDQLQPPVALSYEPEYQEYLKQRRFPICVKGGNPAPDNLRAGVPFPRGAVRDTAGIRVLDAEGRPVLCQVEPLSPWDDGSIRWALLSFTAERGRNYTVDFSGSASGSAVPTSRLSALRDDTRVVMKTGVISATCTPRGLLEVLDGQGRRLISGMHLVMNVHLPGGSQRWVGLPADEMVLESAGPVHALARLRGKMGPPDGPPSAFTYEVRLYAAEDSGRLQILVTFTHMTPREGTEADQDDPRPVVAVGDVQVIFDLGSRSPRAVLGLDRGARKFDFRQGLELIQPDDLTYTIQVDGTRIVEGTRAPGWLAAETEAGWTTIGVRHFWQNCPKSLMLTPEQAVVGLWAGPEPFSWEATLAKTHELVLDFGDREPSEVVLDPLRISMPPAWACSTEAAGGPLLPRCREAILQFPHWEIMRVASMNEWVRGMPKSFRDFGDAYMGGPYKGKNAYSNLEYDVHFNFLLEYLRTGQTWYVDAAEVMARHQADVDTDHWTGQPWKHSPQHTTTYAEFGHVFLRGLVMHYLLTGEKRSLEVARRIGDFIAPRAERKEGFGNERQIGWGLYALTGLYEATRDEKYIRAASALCNILLSEQSPTGQFNIRYDNRIAFFNGIAMNAMLTVEKQTGDPRLLEGVMRVAVRTLGMYPEYACRTLNAYSYLAEKTGDPRFIDVTERTWLTSIDWLNAFNWRGGATVAATHAWHFPHMAARRGLAAIFDNPPAVCPDPATWKGLRLAADAPLEVYVRATGGQPAPMFVLLGRLATGRVELLNDRADTVQRIELTDSRKLFQPAVLSVPADGRIYLLRMTAQDAESWDIQGDASSAWVVHAPRGRQLENIYPRAFGYIRDGAADRFDEKGNLVERGIRVRLEVMGEGFHTATLYDPHGRIAATVRRFVDFQDPGRYEMVLEASPPPNPEPGWSLEVYNAKVLSVDGLLPYWSPTPDELFNPEYRGR